MDDDKNTKDNTNDVNKRLEEAGVETDIDDNISAITGRPVLTDAAGISESNDDDDIDPDSSVSVPELGEVRDPRLRRTD